LIGMSERLGVEVFSKMFDRKRRGVEAFLQ
jgi:hypothetical protein